MSSKGRPEFLASRQGFFTWLRELAKFGAVGAIAYVVDAGGFNLLVYGPGQLFGDQPVRGGLVSGFVSIIVAWIGNRYWTFRAQRNENMGKEFLSFLVVNIIGVLIAQSCLYVSRWLLDFSSPLADNLSRNIIGVGLGTIFRYFCYKFIVFRGKKTP